MHYVHQKISVNDKGAFKPYYIYAAVGVFHKHFQRLKHSIAERIKIAGDMLCTIHPTFLLLMHVMGVQGYRR